MVLLTILLVWLGITVGFGLLGWYQLRLPLILGSVVWGGGYGALLAYFHVTASTTGDDGDTAAVLVAFFFWALAVPVAITLLTGWITYVLRRPRLQNEVFE